MRHCLSFLLVNVLHVLRRRPGPAHLSYRDSNATFGMAVGQLRTYQTRHQSLRRTAADGKGGTWMPRRRMKVCNVKC